MMRRRRSRPAGLTLVELLVSVTLITVALAAIPISLRVTGSMARLARDGTIALVSAQAKLEELIAAEGSRGDGTDTLSSGAAALTRTWQVDPGDPQAVLRRLVVTVTWEDGAHRVALETFAW
jgi:Tfp pilus assembly protein PilV